MQGSVRLRSEWVIGGATIVAGWAAFAAASGRPLENEYAQGLDQSLSAVAAAVGAIAAGLFLVEWRVRRHTRDLWLAAGFGLFALVRVGIGRVAVPLLEQGTEPSRAVASTAVVLSLVVFALALTNRDGARSARRRLGLLAGVAVAVLVVVVPTPDLTGTEQAAGSAAVHGGIATAWLALAVIALRRHQDAPALAAVGAGFVGLAQGRIALLIGDAEATWGVASAYFRVAALLVVLIGAVRQVELGYRQHRDRLVESLAREARSAERSHDLQAALFAVEAAVHTLNRHGDALDPAALEVSTAVLQQEVARIRSVLKGDEPVQRFDVARTLDPVVAIARARGAVIDLRSSPGVEAIGRPAELAEAVRNLLENARTHAPGARVDLSISVDAGQVTITVEDDGPGLPSGAEQAVLLRGVRASRRPGRGLGLSSASRRLAEQGGALHVERPARGSRFVVTVPVAQDRTQHEVAS